jgi:hypothetical protein
MNKNKKSRKKTKNSSQGSAKLALESAPPRLLINIVQKRFRMRWQATNASSASPLTYRSISFALLLKSGIATTPGAIALFEATRLRRIQMWAPATIGATVAFEANANSGTAIGVDSRRYVDSSTTTAFSSTVDWRPSGIDTPGSWQNASSPLLAQTLGYLTFTTGAIVDLTFDFTCSDGSFPVLFASAAVTAAAPGVYAYQWDANLISVDYNMVF